MIAVNSETYFEGKNPKPFRQHTVSVSENS
jgi:hypothetical protein